ncbi:MAG TPA: N-acetylmuramoyl-L-alanine amidase, partial [Longimicrobium sp.]|nr:N-acetylmuramoyl-L-alanine amidase [Longimicrobium sp.]
GIQSRWRLAVAAAAAANPIDAFLAIHTNAANGAARGVSAFYLDVRTVHPGGVEHNDLGRDYATALRDTIRDRCHIQQRAVGTVTTLGGNADLQNTYDHFRAGGGGADPRAAAPAAPAWDHVVFPRRVPAALVEVAFHDNAEDAALLSRAWFRRLAGEAMAMATEARLRTAAATRADVVRLLTAAFGPTAHVGALAADAQPGGPDLAAHVLAATGEAGAAPGDGSIGAAADAVEAARRAFTRTMLAETLRDALAAAAGYPDGDARIATLVTAALLQDRALADLPRPGAPATRADAGTLVALAFGWAPATLATVLARPIGAPPAPLVAPLAGAPFGDRFVPRVEATELGARIRALQPEHLVRVTGIHLGDAARAPLPASGTPPHATVAPGTEVTFVAEVAGIIPRVLAGQGRVVVEDGQGFRHELPVQPQGRGRVATAPWAAAFPDTGAQGRVFTVRLVARHDTRGDLAIGSRELRVTSVPAAA